MLETLAKFHFLRPAYLLLLLPLLAVIALQWHRESAAAKWLSRLPDHLRSALLLGENNWRRSLPLQILLPVMLLSIVVLSGPTWQRQPSPFAEDHAPLVVVLDTSSSMAQTDLAPSRIERARLKLQDILAARQGSPTGLVVYAGSAHTVLPLSNDTSVIEPMLAALEPGLVPRMGKFAEQALPLIEQQLAHSPVPGSVLLMTDGVGSETEARFSQFFAEHQHQLLILGIGSDSQADSNSNSKAIPLQRDALKQLARASGGAYRTISAAGDSDVDWLQGKIEQHLVQSADQNNPWQDMGYGLVYPIALLCLLWFRRGWLVQWGRAAGIFAVLSVGMFTPQQAQAAEWRFADLWLTADQQGQLYFQLENYSLAAERFVDPLHKGMAYYFAEEFELAREYFSRVDSPEAMFNAANALAHNREYVAARDLYDALLKREPGYRGAQENRDYLQRIIDEINRLSESQASEKGESSRELGDTPQTAEGAERQYNPEQLIESEPETYSAEQLLQDQALSEKWMRQVQPEPGKFLRAKFLVQLEQREQADATTVETQVESQQ